MTRTLKFYGVSDDLFECEGTRPGDGEPDEIGCYDSDCVLEIKDSKGNGLRIVGRYAVAENGCWAIAIAQMDEDLDLPDWPMKFGVGGRGYSVLLTIEAPDDARVRVFSEGETGA